jgi:hypothetical protein
VTNEEVTHLVFKAKVRNSVQKDLPLVCILSQIDPVCVLIGDGVYTE